MCVALPAHAACVRPRCTRRRSPVCSAQPVPVLSSRRASLAAALCLPILSLAPQLVGSARAEDTAALQPLPAVAHRVFLDITANDKPLGRLVVGVFGDSSPAPLAAQRFLELATGAVPGVSYRRTPVDGLRGDYIVDSGVRTFTYAQGELGTRLAGGDTARRILPEADAPGALRHDRRGLVSLLVRSEAPPPELKEKLTAVKGQLVSIRESAPPEPNGSGFAISLGPSTRLDELAVVVGTLLEGDDVLEALSALPRNRNADEEGAFFAIAKAVGDKRALVREKGSGRPLAKVVVSACGELS